MYLGIDIGGTKTLVAALDQKGQIAASLKFPTPADYDDWLKELKHVLKDELPFDDFRAGAIAAPGRIDREHGIFGGGGNLHWQNEHIPRDVERLVNCPMLLENDANLAGLSEAILLKGKYDKVMYVTISTGIGTGFVSNGMLEPNLLDSEGGDVLVQWGDHPVKWESIGSGKAIFETYNQKASDIEDPKIWAEIAKRWTVGFIDLISISQPDVIVLGGGVGHYLPKYHDILVKELKEYETPVLKIPPIVEAQRPEEAVVYGCYELARSVYA